MASEDRENALPVPTLLQRYEAHRPPRMHEAACRSHPEVSWFSQRDLEAARAVCSSCVVRAECAAFASIGAKRYGVWGGGQLRGEDRRRTAALGPSVRSGPECGAPRDESAS